MIAGVIAALCPVALLGADWYHAAYNAAATTLGETTVSAWGALHGADIAVAVLATTAAVLMLLRPTPLTAGAAAGAAIAALVIVVYHMIDKPGDFSAVDFTVDVGLRIGVWLSLVAALALAGAAISLLAGERG